MDDFICSNNHASILLINVPYRHNRAKYSLENNEIRAYNKKLMKIIGACNHTKLIEINDNRKLYTNQGLHLNKLGKILISKQISSTIVSHRQTTSKVQITIDWYSSPANLSNLDTTKDIENSRTLTN
jgi:hypothetical protein